MIASSSAGNCYTVSDSRTKIMLDCGISIRRIKEGSGFSVCEIAGCLISHEH